MSCEICNKNLISGKRFCSYACRGIFNRKRIKKFCEICAKEFEITQGASLQGGRTCSRKCHFIYQSRRPYIKGNKHHCWKGGLTVNAKGYVFIKSYHHPNRDSNNNMLEHRLAMEKLLGMIIPKKLDVHHIDGNPSNNNTNNLALVTRAAHRRIHNLLERGV